MKLVQALVMVGISLMAQVGMAGDVLLAFTAKWCRPCQQFKADLAADDQLAAGYEVDVVDVNVAQEMAADFDVGTVPTFFVVKVGPDGVIKKANAVKTQVGYNGPAKLKRWLAR